MSRTRAETSAREDQSRENLSAMPRTRTERARGKRECDNQDKDSLAATRVSERERERTRKHSFIAPGAGGANNPHVRSSEAALHT